MSNEKHNSNFGAGMSLLTGILGTLSSFMRSNSPRENMTSRTSNAAASIKESINANKRLLLGGVAGGLIGAAAALLLAPKSGHDLVRGLFPHLQENKRARPASGKTVSAKRGKRKSSDGKAEDLLPVKKRRAVRKTAESAKPRKAVSEKKEPMRRKKRGHVESNKEEHFVNVGQGEASEMT